MKIFEFVNKPSGIYGLSGTSITVNDLLLIEDNDSKPIDLLTQDQIDAISNSNNPSESNPFATLDDIETQIPPIAESYLNQSAMIADQSGQTSNYIYYDGTLYWEYLGTINGNITDYREVGGNIELYFEKTYAEILTLLQSGNLVTGATYKITNYQTIHLILHSTDIRTGPVEPLFVKALSSTEIDKRATSAIYPDDIIEYDFLNNVAEDGITPTKGLILFRHDLINNLSCFYDWREVVFRRWRLSDKRQEEIIATTPSTLQITTTYTNLTSTIFNTNARKIHTKVSPTLTHNAGSLTLTITNGTITYTRQLTKMNGSSSFSANELANKRGIIVNCNIRNVFIFWYSNSFGYGGEFGFGNEVLGFDLSPFPTSTFTVGDGIVFEVNSSIYQDIKTFDAINRGGVYRDVHLGLRTQVNYNVGASRFNNVIFYASATHVTAGAHVTNTTFLGNVTASILETEIVNSIFLYSVAWSHLMECVYSYFGNIWHAELNKGHHDGCTIYGSNFGHSFENSTNYSTIVVRGYGGKFLGWIWNSVVDITAASTGGNATSFSCSTYLENTILGQIDGNLADIRTPMAGRSFYQLETNRFTTYMSSANLYNPPTTPTGITQNIVIDASGNLVKVPFTNLSETTQVGNTSLVVIKHPDGVAPEDSATVGQLEALETSLEETVNLRTFGIDIDGSGSVITTGIKGYAIIPYNCEILAWYIIGDTVGSIEIDIWKSTSIPNGSNSICGSDRPKLASAQENLNETLTLWTIGINSGDVVAFNVVSATTLTKINLIIKTKLII